jgi:hypothetical protein
MSRMSISFPFGRTPHEIEAMVQGDIVILESDDVRYKSEPRFDLRQLLAQSCHRTNSVTASTFDMAVPQRDYNLPVTDGGILQ